MLEISGNCEVGRYYTTLLIELMKNYRYKLRTSISK